MTKSNKPVPELHKKTERPIGQANPDKLSLDAYAHIQKCLNGKDYLEKEDVTAILRLSQHLRVFGLLSAVGYINQAKEGKIVEKTVPMWYKLLSSSLNMPNANKRALMEAITKMATERPKEYMSYWKLTLALSNYWNFWARAYKKED